MKEVQELAADSAEDVMILTPYIAQCEKLRERLQVGYKNLRIGTVISSQGWFHAINDMILCSFQVAFCFDDV